MLDNVDGTVVAAVAGLLTAESPRSVGDSGGVWRMLALRLLGVARAICLVAWQGTGSHHGWCGCWSIASPYDQYRSQGLLLVASHVRGR